MLNLNPLTRIDPIILFQRIAMILTAFVVVILLFGIIAAQSAQAAQFNLNVVSPTGPNGALEPVTGFRWLVEQDNSHPVTPGAQVSDSLSFDFHASHAPVATSNTGQGLQGESTGSSVLVTDVPVTGGNNQTRYFVSVLPFSGYTLGGAQVTFSNPGEVPNVNVIVHPNPLPTAQISVFVFEDNQPINNIPDLPEETGLEGFSIILEDAAGRYGIAGGTVTQDAFGNPLGTEYAPGDSTTITKMGNGVITTNAEGVAVIKNLPPGKYGIQTVPPSVDAAGNPVKYHQTSTIEGKKVIDAWVKANEPQYFLEFGPPGHHVFIGYVKEFTDTSALTGGVTLSGQVTNLHNSRPPDFTFFSAQPVPVCWVGLNDLAVGVGRGVYSAPCNENSEFSIPNVPPGNYQLAFWDANLDYVIALVGVTVNADGTCQTPTGSCDFVEVPIFNWFGRLEASVFYDRNQNGFRDCFTPDCNDVLQDDVGLPADSSAVNIRFRDGTVYQSFPIDTTGSAPFDEVFPFFHWLVAEVDFATLKATGATYTVDAGGPVVDGETLNPQQQCISGAPETGDCVPAINPNTLDNLSTTVTGPALTFGMQTFLGQTNRMEFGKSNYGAGENGGISGIVYYAVTRAEDDPRYAAAEEWEPGIPRVQVALYQDKLTANGLPAPLGDTNIDDINGVPGVQLADVDNYPFGWSSGGTKGPEDIERSGTDGVWDKGDAIEVTTTDSWDDNLPTGCQGERFIAPNGDTIQECYDGLRNFNQIREAVFDGGYAFGLDPASPLPVGTYIVEATTPPGYVLLKEEDRNVDFGEEYTPGPLALPPECVGDEHTVPDYFSHVTDATGNLLAGYDPVESAVPAAGQPRRFCDRKTIRLTSGKNAAVDFFMFTQVPKAARVVGFILDDTSNEFDPNSPNFGEKYAPPWLPVSFKDWTGREIARVYSDEFGKYNALLPSTFTVNVASPSGVSPNMLTACMNDASPIPNPAYNPNNPVSTEPQFIPDPYYNRQYSQFCYTFQYMPGVTTYLDTPVIPIAAFAGPNQFPLDCEISDGVPMVLSVNRIAADGGGGPYVLPGQSIRIRSAGLVDVPNPEYDGSPGSAKTITRNHRFGGQGQNGAVTIEENGIVVPLTISSWNPNNIQAQIPQTTTPGTYQLMVTRNNGEKSPMGVTVIVGQGNETIRNVPANYGTIQAAIDAANPGDIVMVAPGTYDELVVMYKPVQLQGWGALATVINAVKTPAEKLQQWRDKVNALFGDGANGIVGDQFDLVPGQELGFNTVNNEPLLFTNGEGPGVLVVAKDTGPTRFRNALEPRIDGFSIVGADHGGGIFVNGYANFLQISNNRIASNAGVFGGGIRVGHADLTSQLADGTLFHSDASNDRISIHHNHITQNGSLSGAGGGIALYTGADRYSVTDNFICGNFAQSNGGGIGHFGLSDLGSIESNIIAFNESFNQGQSVSGGGIYIGGKPGLNAVGELTTGSGRVSINANLIQGNLAGAGDGGGIRTEFVNGADIAADPNTPANWHRVDIFNNMIANNVAGLAGGGISMQDTARIRITNNTVANNDSTATAGEAFTPGSPNESTIQPAGIVSRAHSAALANAIQQGTGLPNVFVQGYSRPQAFRNNIIWHNRSFYFVNDPTTIPPTYGLVPNIAAGDDPIYDDLAVLGIAGSLAPRYSILSETYTGNGANHPSNILGDPGLVTAYVNGDRGQTVIMPEAGSTIQAQPAFDEGGNFIDVRFGPLSLNVDVTAAPNSPSNYHIGSGSAAIDAGLSNNIVPLTNDFDGDVRPQGAAFDIGADEVTP